MVKNNLRELRTQAKVGITELSEAAELPRSVILDTEKQKVEPQWDEKSRIVLALNRVGSVKHRPQDVFPIK